MSEAAFKEVLSEKVFLRNSKNSEKYNSKADMCFSHVFISLIENAGKPFTCFSFFPYFYNFFCAFSC